jgi:hypothetical protein
MTANLSRPQKYGFCFSGKPPQAIVHIRCLFSVLADGRPLSFLGLSPDSIYFHCRRVRLP